MGLFGSKAPDIDQLEQDKDAESLLKALKFNDAVVKINAMGALARMHDTRAIDEIVPFLKDPFYQMYAVMALATIGDASIPSLVRALDDRSATMRAGAARTLRDVSDGRAIEPLVRLLKDTSQNVKIEAIYALGRAKDPRAVEHLIKVLRDETVFSEAAEDALASLGEHAVWPLITALKTNDAQAKGRIAETLAKIGKPALEPLAKSLGEEDTAIRTGAAIALGRTGDARAIEPLLEYIRQDKMEKFLQEDAAAYKMRMIENALAAIGESAIEPLTHALEDDNGIVRWVASEALRDIKK